MSCERTIWHTLFAALVEERAPRNMQVIVEHVLGVEPQKADLLLIRRGKKRNMRAGTLRGLWPELTRESLVEFKSATRPPRRGDWIRLLGYGAQHHSKQIKRLDRASELTLVLVVPSLTPTIHREARSLGWTISSLGGGYHRVHGSEYPGVLAVLCEIAEVERDDLIRMFATAIIQRDDSRRWLMARSTSANKKDPYYVSDEEYEEALKYASEKVSRETLLLLMTPEILRNLKPEYIASLPKTTRAKVRKRMKS